MLVAMGSSTVPTPVALSDAPESERQRARFLQERMARFGFLLTSLSAMFWFFTIALKFFFRFDQNMWACLRAPDSLWHLAGILASLGLWLLTRQRTLLSPKFLIRLDTLGLLVLGLCNATMGWWIEFHGDRFGHGVMVGFMATCVLVIAHAIIVPGGRRVLMTHLLTFVPTLIVLLFPPETSPRMFIRGLVIMNVLWAACYIALAVVASQALHGLRERVREARQLGQYRLEEKIGSGGMGQVFRASHSMLRRPTAIKLLPPGDVTPDQLARFEREVQLTSLLTHPNTVSVFDYGRTPDGVFYYAMEYLEGLNLDDLVTESGPLPPGRVIHILNQVCGALAEAHGRGLIHRDIKPANIFLCQRGGVPDFVKVLDFGLVKDVSGEDQPLDATEANLVTGTPQYLSPESITDPSSIDHRSDLYAVGALAYFLLTGKPVFEARTVVAVCSMHLTGEPAPFHKHVDTSISSELETLVMACLAKEPDQRPATAEVIAAVLASIPADPWTHAQALAWWEKRQGSTHATKSRPHQELALGETVQVDLTQRIALADSLPTSKRI